MVGVFGAVSHAGPGWGDAEAGAFSFSSQRTALLPLVAVTDGLADAPAPVCAPIVPYGPQPGKWERACSAGSSVKDRSGAVLSMGGYSPNVPLKGTATSP